MTRRVAILLAVIALVVGIGAGLGVGLLVQQGTGSQVAAVQSPPADEPTAGATGTDPGAGSPAPTASGASPAPPTEAPSPSATPAPTPLLFPAPLDGVPVSEALAKRHVIAVMIDDLDAARPQSGLSRASVVWQAPAEGGIPRYMALFGEGDPPSVGPIRSSRLYFISWASEWRSVYVHSGGSPQALGLLNSSKGRGAVVFNADEFRWGNSYLWRITTRLKPHNVYTDGKNLRKLARAIGAKAAATVPQPNWRFAVDAPLETRPVGGSIVVPYTYNKISYKYDRVNNRYLRTVSVEGKQVDAGTQERIAPKNVVVMMVPFVPLGDHKHRLDGLVTGSGTAYIFSNGKVTKGTWAKKSFTSPTRFFDKAGNPVTLTIGQTFVQVVQTGTKLTIVRGTPAPGGTPGTAPSPSPSAGA